MDLMAEINDYRYSPEQVRARQARRAAREKLLYSQLAVARGAPSAVMEKRAHGWNMPVDGQEPVDGSPIGGQHPGAAALLVVRQAMGEYKIPNKVELRYAGMKRASGHGAFMVDEGVIFVEATMHSISGPRHHIDVPVVVREGRLLSPSIIIHDGNKRVMTQSTFDDILGMGEFKANAADRGNMYSPPPDKDASARPRRQVPVINPGMFHVAPSRRLIQSALKGFEMSAAVSASETAMRFVNAYEHDIKKGEFADLAEVESSMRQTAQVIFMRDAIPAGFQPGMNRDRIVAEARAFADEVVAMALPEVEGAFGERDAQLKKMLAPALMGLGLATAPGPASQVAKSKGPASPEVRAVKDGFEAGKLQKRQTELSKLNTPKVGPLARGGRRAFYEPDVSGVVENGSLGSETPGASNSHLDVGERPMDDMLAPGQSVTLKSNATARDRGGVAYEVPKGSKGTVVRDVDGAGWAYYVRFSELGFSATVPRKALA